MEKTVNVFTKTLAPSATTTYTIEKSNNVKFISLYLTSGSGTVKGNAVFNCLGGESGTIDLEVGKSWNTPTENDEIIEGLTITIAAASSVKVTAK